MTPRQPSLFNVADHDIILGSVPCFLSCLPAHGPTARPFGTTLQALDLSDLHSVTRVPFFPSDVASTSISPSCLPLHPCTQRPRPSCFPRPIATGIQVHILPRALTL